MYDAENVDSNFLDWEDTLSTVISFVYKDKFWFDESMSVIFCMENAWKRILLFPLHINSSLN